MKRRERKAVIVMKHLYTLTAVVLAMALLAMPTVAGADSMVIHYKDGKTTKIPLNSVERIEFQGATERSFAPSLPERNVDIIAKHSGKCVDVAGVSISDGANIYQWPCHGGSNQKWRLVDRGEGFYEVRAAHSGKCLDVSGPSKDNAANVHQWRCHGGDNQLWQFIPQGGGYYLITSKYSGKCLDVSGVSKDDGANIYQWDCHGGDNQLWKLR
ncbi:MAG: RICIN domain-containing protein [Syntrophales bacterium]|nr:RICIN domain-containing protein [Syntrophales bacterium]